MYDITIMSEPARIINLGNRSTHFHKAGTTTETRYAPKADEDFAGSITVQIVSRHADGLNLKVKMVKSSGYLPGFFFLSREGNFFFCV
jgi:hypothetical protein